jgi:hypothetical protein
VPSLLTVVCSDEGKASAAAELGRHRTRRGNRGEITCIIEKLALKIYARSGLVLGEWEITLLEILSIALPLEGFPG